MDKNNKKEFKLNQKARDHCHYTGKYRRAAHSICNLRYKIPKEISVVFHNGFTYDDQFIIKKLATEFKGNFERLGENTEKYITFSVPIKKEHDNGKKYVKITKEIPVVFHNGSTYDYQFITKKLPKEFKGNFECLLGNTEKYITFSVPIKKEHDNGKPTIYKLKFIDSYRFTEDSL